MLFGGWSNKKSFYSFSPSKQQWTKISDLPSKRCSHGSVVIGNSIFIGGGYNNNTIEEYNISTKTFEKVATMNKSLSSFGICPFSKSEVLIAGGSHSIYEVTNNCFLFNTNSKTFKDIGDMNTKKFGHVLVNVEGVVYSIGGRDVNYAYLNTIEILDPKSKQWKTSSAKLNIARYNHQAVAHKYFIYIFGGYCESTRSCDGYTDTIEKFNLLTGNIELLDVKLYYPRQKFAVGKIYSDVYIIGGSNGYNLSMDKTEIFNLETEEIEKGEKIPVSDCSFTACVV